MKFTMTMTDGLVQAKGQQGLLLPIRLSKKIIKDSKFSKKAKYSKNI